MFFEPFGVDLGERTHNEVALTEPRVGDGERGGVDGEVSVENDVEVDDAVGVTAVGVAVMRLTAAYFPLDSLRFSQEFERTELGFEACAGVDEPVVGVEPPRFGLYAVAEPEIARRQQSQPFGCAADVMLAVAEVASNVDMNSRH